MADVIVSAVAEQLISIVKEQIQQEIKLVRGVEKELLDLSDKLNNVRNVLEDAERKQFKEKTVKDWLRRLEEKSYEMEDVLDEWNYAIIHHNKMESGSGSAPPPKQKVCSFFPSSCFCFKKLVVRHDIANKVQNLKSRLDEILNEKDVHNFVISQPKSDPYPASSRVQSTSLIDLAKVQGRKDDVDILANTITTHKGSGYQILSIVGVGGLGKTTLAQLVYNDSRVKQCFDFRIWICVSDLFDVAAIAKGIINSINEKSFPETIQLDALLQDLIGCISGKRILLVLDDVWNEQPDKWEPLKNALEYGGAGSKILVTTRKENVARIMGTTDEDIHRLGLLSDEDCQLLLMSIAFSGRSVNEPEKFQEIGKEIARKCNGLSLAAKTLGSVLRSKNTIEGWKNVLKSETWGLKQVEVELFPHLLLSYNELSSMVKRCFSFCAFFPKDMKLEVEKLIRIWMALGYLGSNIGNVGDDMKLKGQDVFEDLATRSLFQDFEKDELTEQIRSCKMHDIVHDFAQFLRKNSRAEALGMTKRTCQVCDLSLVSHVQEYHSLFWVKESHLNLCDCLANLRVLKYRNELLNGIPHGMEKLIHLRWLDISCTKISKEDLKTICNLYFLQTLLLVQCSLKDIPSEIENLIHLRYLDLSYNKELKELPESMCSLVELQTLLLNECSLEEISTKIGNLIHLRYLDLSYNRDLTKLPKSICSLVELETLRLVWRSLEEIPKDIGNMVQLRHLHLSSNGKLKELPESMCSLVELQTLDILGCRNLHRLPEGLANLSGIRSLNPFLGGSGYNRFGLLKKLNSLNGSLELSISISGNGSKELVEDAREAELRNKIHLHKIKYSFTSDRDKEECSSSLWVDVIEALEPNQNLQFLEISYYMGSRFPNWISSPLNLVREIVLSHCTEVSSLPPMGELPFLEVLHMFRLMKLEVLGVEWLGIRGREGEMIDFQSSSLVAFPKLKELRFYDCRQWWEWEDITAEEVECTGISVMPCLTKLIIQWCRRLKMLPHRLLSKASSLQVVDIKGSVELIQSYREKDGTPWSSISLNNPQLELLA